jgi:hypothetical protein
VATGLPTNEWIRDIQGTLTVPALVQYVRLRERLQSVVLDPYTSDHMVWKWSPSGSYSASSAYAAMFHGQTQLLGAKEIWKVKAPAEVKFFIWLAIQDRCWTSERMQRHGLVNHGPCALCSQEAEAIDHLLLGCAFSREIWFKTLRTCHWQNLTPSHDACLAEWWTQSRKQVSKGRRKAFDSLVVLVARCIWLERNSRVFRNQSSTVTQLLQHIRI